LQNTESVRSQEKLLVLQKQMDDPLDLSLGF